MTTNMVWHCNIAGNYVKWIQLQLGCIVFLFIFSLSFASLMLKKVVQMSHKEFAPSFTMSKLTKYILYRLESVVR